MRTLTFSAALALVAVPILAQTAKKTTAHAKSTASVAPSVAAPWRVAYHDTQVTVTIDTSATRKTADGFFQTHLKWVYASDQGIDHNKKSYRTLVEDRLLDCDYVQTKPINATVYDANGKVVNSFTTPMSDVQYMSWSRRKAGTPNERALTAVCRMLRPASKRAAAKAKAASKKK